MKKRIRYKLKKKQHIIKDLKFHEYCETKKKDFPDGPWNKEPNKIYFKASGFDCMVKRVGEFGTLCGYVGVTKDHPLFDVPYTNEKFLDLSVHGGITFSERCVDDICHPGKNKVFWLGFDCGHAFDYIPKLTPMVKGNMPYKDFLKKDSFPEIYRNIDYVKQECRDLAKQLRAMQP